MDSRWGDKPNCRHKRTRLCSEIAVLIGLVPDLPPAGTWGIDFKSVRSDVLQRRSKNRAERLQTMVVLTVVAEPPGNGAQVFRPPYEAINKPYYYVSNGQTFAFRRTESSTLQQMQDGIKWCK